MGVQGLWELLAPVGRRVSVETLAGKKLAIDASIWMVQFLKAMRDEKGEMVRNAHLLGFFRRICKLLFLRTKPVFVFDGATPSLKRRTLALRRRHRENAQAKIRKTAEKLLLNHLKTKRLEELAQQVNDNNNNKKKNCSNSSSAAKDSKDEKGKQFACDNQNEHSGGNTTRTQEALDEMLAASLAAEEEDNSKPSSTNRSDGILPNEEEGDEDDNEDEEMIYVSFWLCT